MTLILAPEAVGPLLLLATLCLLGLLVAIGIFLQLWRLSRSLDIFVTSVEEGEPIEIAFRIPRRSSAAKPVAQKPPKPRKPTLPN